MEHEQASRLKVIRKIVERQKHDRPASQQDPDHPVPSDRYRVHEDRRERAPESTALPGWKFRVIR